MLPPSHGATHPSGKPWTLHKGGYGSIPSITSDEREALFDVARSYDDSPATKPAPPVDPGQRVPHQRFAAGEFRESWIEMVEEHLRSTWEMQQLLERYGWSFCYQDRHGRQLMHRPGKDGDGVGGSINLSDRFHPFSSSTPFPDASAGKKAPTWDRIGVIATYEYGGDRMAALNEIARTTGILDAWKKAKDAELHREMDALTNPQPQVETRGTGELVDHAPVKKIDRFLFHIKL
jgi:putative DNA primase/helicase